MSEDIEAQHRRCPAPRRRSSGLQIPARSRTWLGHRDGGRSNATKCSSRPPSERHSIYVVVSGTFRVFNVVDARTPSPRWRSSTTAKSSANSVYSTTCLRSASIAALRRSEIVEIPASSFRTRLRHSDPAIPRQMVTMLAARLRTVTDGLADLAYLDLGGRLAKYLLNESERQGRPHVHAHAHSTELGQMLGGARQSVNQVMRTLEDAGSGRPRRSNGARSSTRPGLRSRSMSSGRPIRMNSPECQTDDISRARCSASILRFDTGGCGAHHDDGEQRMNAQDNEVNRNIDPETAEGHRIRDQ